MRPDGRANDELRPITIERDFTTTSHGSVLVSFGDTKVLCTATVELDVPRWMKNTGKGWVTSEYSMLPGSSPDRIGRERKGPKGRTHEIERLIGRSLRAVVDMKALGERQIHLDCDVLQADGGTRTAAITGAYVALALAVRYLKDEGVITTDPLSAQVAAVSCGIFNDVPVLDLDYPEDSAAQVDANFVMASGGKLIEIQGTGEQRAFSRDEFNSLIDLAIKGTDELFAAQRKALGL